MTKAGFGFIVAGGFVYFVASQTQVGWLYLFDAMIWSLLLMSAIFPWWSLRSLHVERRILLPRSTLHHPKLGPLEDETVEVRLKVTNNGRVGRHFIKVLEDCPFDQPESRHRGFLLASISPRSATAFSYTATCYRRGHYISAGTTLQSSGPLGLVVRRRTFPLPVNLTVYPTYYHMEGPPAAEAAWADWGHAVKSSMAAEFYGSREYQYGDPLKHIHWRNTARRGHFMLKEFEEASLGSVAVAFETRHEFGTGRETTLEYSIKIAASLAKLCADSGRGIDILAGETPLQNAGWREALDYLAGLEAGGEATLAQLTAPIEPGRALLAIVPAAETDLVAVWGPLSRRAGRMVVVLLEGFAPGEIPHDLLSRLKGGNLDIVRCSQGNLGAAIEKLGVSLFFAGKPAAPVG
jgi:uncharacterized protein (DUF58 family)